MSNMKKEYLDRITFLGENKIMIDETHIFTINKDQNTRKYVCESNGKCLDSEEFLFDYVDEMTDTGSVGGGIELPFASPKNKNAFMRRTFAPYTEVVESVEYLVKSALIEEYVKQHPTYDLIKLYRDANGKASEEHQSNLEKGINIVYAQILPAAGRNYYTDNNDYNGDGIPNQHKENATNLDLQYDGASDAFKERVTAELSKDPAGIALMQAAVTKAQAKDANPTNHNLIQMGSDIEFTPKPEEPKKAAPQAPASFGGVASLGFKLKEGQSYRFKFKTKNFEEDKKSLTECIPEKVKVENTIFEMQDCKGNNYLIEWKNGEPTLLEYKNILVEQEEKSRLNKLFEYKTPNDKKSRNGVKKIAFDFFTKSKKPLNESDFTKELEAKVESLNNGNLSGHAVGDVLDKINKEVEGYGVEVVRDHEQRQFWGDVRLKYINMGDAYVNTIIYDIDKELFVVNTLEDYIAENNIQTK